MTKYSESENMRKIMLLTESKVLTEGSYWNKSGKYPKQADYLENLVPTSGPAETHQGEIMRAASKIYYDYFNNGFGNNWSNALAYLVRYTNMDKNIEAWLSEYALHNIIGQGSPEDDANIEQMMNDAIEYAISNVDPDKPLENDMWDTPTTGLNLTPEETYDDDDYDYYEDEYDTGDDYMNIS